MDDRAAGLVRLGCVVFTGRLATMPRMRAAELVRDHGGRVTTAVSRRSSMLVVGMDGWPVRRDGTVSRNLRRAEQLNASGSDIRIVSEAVFLQLVGLSDDCAAVRKSFPLEQVCSLLDLQPDQLRRWEALDLVRSRDGQYDFQDIVSLRTIAGLIHRGVSPQVIARSMRGLARVLPGTERPLAQLTIVEHSGALLAEVEDALVDPDGQLIIDFDRSRDERCASLRLVDGRDNHGADDWFALGHECEGRESLEEAVDAYRAALAQRPNFPEAHFNLANALRGLDRLEAAEEHLLMAVSQQPDLVTAWYNLADIQEEQGRCAEAIESLQAALRVDPTFADARYNLALCYDEIGNEREAAGHWRQYLALDPDSPWAEQARRFLAGYEV